MALTLKELEVLSKSVNYGGLLVFHVDSVAAVCNRSRRIFCSY
jgi:hypothetical protein